MNTESVVDMKTEIESLDELNILTDEELEELILNAAKTKDGASIFLAPGKVAFSFIRAQLFDAKEYIGDSYAAAGRISIAIDNLLIDGRIRYKELEPGSGRLAYVATNKS